MPMCIVAWQACLWVVAGDGGVLQNQTQKGHNETVG
jgi:hypothetical protein